MFITDFKQLEQFRGIPAIYRFYFKNNSKNYIGETKDLYIRIVRMYKSELKGNDSRAVLNAIRKYTWKNIKIEVLHWGESIKNTTTRLALEAAFIIKYNSLVINNKGYNILLFGPNTTGFKHSEKSKLKMSLAKKEKYSGKNHPMYGKHHSRKTKQEMGRHRLGKKFNLTPEQHKKRSDSHKGERNHFYGKHHSKKTRKILSKKTKLQDFSHLHKKVKQLDKNTGEVIKVWDSITEAAIGLNGKWSRPIISFVCKKKPNYHSALGFKWEYADEPH